MSADRARLDEIRRQLRDDIGIATKKPFQLQRIAGLTRQLLDELDRIDEMENDR